VESRQQRSRHERTQFGRVRHISEHLHHPDERADHAERRRAVSDRAVYFLALVKVSEEVVAVALEIVTNEIAVVAVRYKAHTLGEERVVDLELFQAQWPFFTRDLGQ